MKKFCLVFVFLLVCPCFFVSCAKESVLDNYTININFDDETKTANVFQKVQVHNTSDNAFEHLCFHIHSNAFKEENIKSVTSKSNFEKVYYNGDSFGGIDIINVISSEADLNFNIEGEFQNYLEIELVEKLYPDENIIVEIEYVLTLPNIKHRFGFGENTINFGNFYPVLCVYEDSVGFVKNEYHAFGDPFYSKMANYEVIINYPSKYTLANTGIKLNESEKNEISSCQIQALNVRDFAFVLSEKFQVKSETVGDCEIIYFYTNDENADESLQTAVESFSFFENKFGDYPYKTLSVVQNDFVYGGMEYPNLVFISNDLNLQEEINYVIVHEIAHQWWYGMVGNNQFKEAWIDESLAEFSSALFFKYNPKNNLSYETITKNANACFEEFKNIYKKIYPELDTSMDRALNEFLTEPEYVNCVYVKGLVAFDILVHQNGEEKVCKMLKTFFKNFQNKQTTSNDLISYVNKYCSKLSGRFFEKFMDGEEVKL